MPKCNALKKRVSSWDEGLRFLPEGEWIVADSQGRVGRGGVGDKGGEARWSEIILPMCKALKNGHLIERKG